MKNHRWVVGQACSSDSQNIEYRYSPRLSLMCSGWISTTESNVHVAQGTWMVPAGSHMKVFYPWGLTSKVICFNKNQFKGENQLKQITRYLESIYLVNDEHLYSTLLSFIKLSLLLLISYCLYFPNLVYNKILTVIMQNASVNKCCPIVSAPNQTGSLRNQDMSLEVLRDCSS